MTRGFLLTGALTAAALTLLVAGCKSSGSGPDQITLNGAGSTYAYPLYSAWIREYAKLHPGLQINYQSIGSAEGIRQVSEGTVDFGAADGPMNDQQLADAKTKRATNILHFPVALGAVVPVYNVRGVKADLHFTPSALAGIFLGKITKWNDPEIAKVNPGVTLPSDQIVVCHRSDRGGATYVWADYLTKVSPEWKSKVGVAMSVSWPVGIGSKGNQGVAAFVSQIANSIGYVELVYAIQNKMTYGQVQNANGKYIKADLNSVIAAAAGAVASMPADFRVSITNTPGADAYPVSCLTWMLVPQDFKDAGKGAALKAFLLWGITDGQASTQRLSYAPLAKPIVDKELELIKTLHY